METCVFLFNTPCLYLSKILHNCKEKDLEICAVEPETKSSTLIILSLIQEPTAGINLFIKNLDDALKHPYKPKVGINYFV